MSYDEEIEKLNSSIALKDALERESRKNMQPTVMPDKDSKAL